MHEQHPQLAIGLHGYHSANNAFPLGNVTLVGVDPASDIDRRNWAVTAVLPHVEQQAMYDSVELYLKPNNSTLVFFPQNKTIMPIFLCPADPNSPKTLTGGPGSSNQQGFHGNYAACAGSTAYNPTDGSNAGDKLNGIFYVQSKTRLSDISDGASSTIFLSELIVSPDINTHDVRGRLFNVARQGGVIFSTLYTPNTTVSDVLQWCQDMPKAPCRQSWSGVNLSTRSYHSGGVNSAFADGSVRFMSNTVNAQAWTGMGTRSGGETITE